MLALAYASIVPDMLRVRVHWSAPPPTSVAYVPEVLARFLGGKPWALLGAAFLLAGLHAACAREKRLRLLLPLIVLPVALMSLQGIAHYPWAFARFLIATVPLLLIVIAAGVVHVATSLRPRRALPIAAGLTALVVASWGPAMAATFAHKAALPWHQVGRFLALARRDGDVIVGGSWLDWWHLQPYLAGADSLYHAAGGLPATPPIRPSGSLYFVSADIPIRGEHLAATFGKIRIARYPPGSLEAGLRRLRSDLLETVTGEPVGPEWAPAYRAILELQRSLHLRADQHRYYRLWIESEDLTPRRRYMPPRARRDDDELRRQLAPLTDTDSADRLSHAVGDPPSGGAPRPRGLRDSSSSTGG